MGNKGRIIHSMGKKLGYVYVLVAAVTAICEASRIVGDYNMNNILMESDPQFVISFVLGREGSKSDHQSC